MTQRAWRSVATLIVGLALFALLAAFDQARGLALWRNYALSGVLLGTPVVAALWWYDVRLPVPIQLTIVAGLLLHYGGGSLAATDGFHMGLLGTHGVNGAYHVYGWWDNLTHGVGIGAGAMAVAYLLESYQLRRGLRWKAALVGLIALLSGLAVGVGVELYEYLGKAAFQTIDQGGYTNTMTDLQYNVLGAALGTLLAVTLDRTVSWGRIRARWAGAAAPPAPRGGTVPPAMAGFVAFVTVPAVATLYLAARFMLQDVAAADEARLYDPALQFLAASAALGALAGPFGYAMARWMRRPA